MRAIRRFARQNKMLVLLMALAILTVSTSLAMGFADALGMADLSNIGRKPA